MWRGQHFATRPVGLADYDFLVAAAVESPEEWTRVFADFPPDPITLLNQILHGVISQYLVFDPNDADQDYPVGVLALYNASFRHGHAWIDLCCVPQRSTDPETSRLHSVVALLEFAFAHWGFRKLYASHLGFQSSPFAVLDASAQSEAVFPDWYRHNNLYWDRTISAITRPAWSAARPRALAAVGL